MAIRHFTLGEFITRMKQGYGTESLVTSHTVQQIGRALEDAFPGEMRNRPICVQWSVGSEGFGPGFRYVFRWTVSGNAAPDLSASPNGFHFSSRAPELIVTDDGFEVSFSSTSP